MAATDESSRNLKLARVQAALLGVAVALVAVSYLPLESVAESQLWSEEEAAERQRVAKEVKRLQFTTPREAGVDEEELRIQRERAGATLDALSEKLEAAQGAPRTWRRRLTWLAALLATAAGGCQFAKE
ncbi:MAG: hypothetical protein AAF961_09740 [Planctomycetota bacterium]